MKSVAALLTLVAVNLANPSASQELPEFDDNDFQVISIEPGSKALVRSNDRDFYCSLFNKESWYVLVMSCQPFVNISEANEADKVILPIEQAAAKAEAEEAAEKAKAEAEAEEAAAVARAKEDRERRLAEEAAKKEAEARAAELIAGFSVEGFSEAIESIARRNGCTLEVGFPFFENPKHFDPLLLELKSKVDMPVEKRSALINLAKAAIGKLYKEGKTLYPTLTTVRFKECE